MVCTTVSRYYAMQYIAGHSLDRVLIELRTLRDEKAGIPSSGTLTLVCPTSDHSAVAAPVAAAAAAGPDRSRRLVATALLTGQYSTIHDRGATNQIAPLPQTERVGDSIAPAPTGAAHAMLLDQPDFSADQSDGSGQSFLVSSSGSLVARTDDRYFREVARFGAQAADALAYAHNRGVHHRDIKPPNLILDPLGNIWVTDFGLAKFEDSEDVSQSQDVVGTLRYMAPERFRGVSDRRCDVYSLGATLYELLTLRPPFEGDDHLKLIRRIENEPPPAPRQLDRRIPRDLETIVQKAMAKNPDDRFATADLMRDELRRYLENRPIRSRPIPMYQRFWRWCQRNPGFAAANITAAVLTTALAIVATFAAWTYRDKYNILEIEQGRTRANLDRAVTAERTASDRLAETFKAQRQARLELGKSLQAEGAALQRSGLVGQRFESLDRLTQAALTLAEHPEGAAHFPVLRDQAVTAMGLTDLHKLWERDVGAVQGIDLMLERYAILEQAGKPAGLGQVVVRSMDNDQEYFRTPPYGVASTELSPDGRYLLVTARDGLVDVWHLPQKTRVFHAAARSGAHPFLADGRQFVFAPEEKDLVVWDLVDRREVRRLPLEFRPHSMCPDPQGRRIAVNADWPQAREIRIIDLATGRTLTRWQDNVGQGPMSWSSDGRLLASGDRDSRLYVWDVEGERLTSVVRGHVSDIGGCQFVPTGHLLATTSWSTTTRFWNGATGELLLSTPLGTPAGFSLDGRRLALYDGSRLGLYEVSHGDEVLTLSPGLVGNYPESSVRGAVHLAGFSPDGRLVAVSTQESVYLYDPHTGRELAQLDAGRCDGVLFDRHGESLITYGARGLFRWPIAADPAGAADALRIGPPALLRETSSDSWFWASWLPDGRTLAMLEKTIFRISLVDTDVPHPARKRAPALSIPTGSSLVSVAVSPDGRWAAAGSYNDAGIYVWNLPKRRLERILAPGDRQADSNSLAAFSPDGRWLASCSHFGSGSGCFFWKVGTWEQGPFVPLSASPGFGEPVFSPDGRIVALCVSPERIRLADAATGRTIANLSTLQPLAPTPLAFSPDCTRLIAKTDQKTVVIWDLGRIRQRLKTMGLDWEQSPYPHHDTSAGPPVPAVRSIRVAGSALEPAARALPNWPRSLPSSESFPTTPTRSSSAGGWGCAWRTSPKRLPISIESCGSGPTTPTPYFCWPRPTARGATSRRHTRP